jgi:hypothetical protein
MDPTLVASNVILVAVNACLIWFGLRKYRAVKQYCAPLAVLEAEMGEWFINFMVHRELQRMYARKFNLRYANACDDGGSDGSGDDDDSDGSDDDCDVVYYDANGNVILLENCGDSECCDGDSDSDRGSDRGSDRDDSSSGGSGSEYEECPADCHCVCHNEDDGDYETVTDSSEDEAAPTGTFTPTSTSTPISTSTPTAMPTATPTGTSTPTGTTTPIDTAAVAAATPIDAAAVAVAATSMPADSA